MARVQPQAREEVRPPAWAEEESSVASGSRLSTAATVGAIALGLGCVLCAASACAYARARSKRAAPAAAEMANPRLFDGVSEGPRVPSGRSTRTRIAGAGGARSGSLPPERLPPVGELGWSATKLASYPGLVTSPVPVGSPPPYLHPGPSKPLDSTGRAQPGSAALERARRANGAMGSSS